MSAPRGSSRPPLLDTDLGIFKELTICKGSMIRIPSAAFAVVSYDVRVSRASERPRPRPSDQVLIRHSRTKSPKIAAGGGNRSRRLTTRRSRSKYACVVALSMSSSEHSVHIRIHLFQSKFIHSKNSWNRSQQAAETRQVSVKPAVGEIRSFLEVLFIKIIKSTTSKSLQEI
ncbi:hypothetical protein EVAR_536_1 [Eumeta japonica]|uniref:Uncharacterized protein n=1 Tax=Eumeta variegata TaxID=151549 RepID=A0A4C1SDU5_EUMVA|nr:hypothetical protein EVAR_536_1 [Eumeta japonica]